LQDAGADVHATQDDGISCLFSATHFRRAAVVQKLLSCGVDPNAANKVGLTPLHVAAAAGDVKLAKTLVYGKGASRNVASLNKLCLSPILCQFVSHGTCRCYGPKQFTLSFTRWRHCSEILSTARYVVTIKPSTVIN